MSNLLMANIYIRMAVTDDLNAIMAIIDDAKQLLKRDGSTQWQDGSPNRELLRSDILKNRCWVLVVGNQLAGTSTLLTEPEPTYIKIEKGSWHEQNERYATIHRLAISSKFRGMHLSQFIFSNLISIGYLKGFRNFRIDTHEVNVRMQKLIKAFDFVYRGDIFIDQTPDGKRLAFELNLD